VAPDSDQYPSAFPQAQQEPWPANLCCRPSVPSNTVSVIREKLADKHDDLHFHYEPFELFWKPTDSSDDIKLHGELYTSPAFLDAHREVQELTSEPGCNLPGSS